MIPCMHDKKWYEIKKFSVIAILKINAYHNNDY